jgi:hypothetical protein
MEPEGVLPCPHCGRKVWFFNFRQLSDPPELPEPRPASLLKNPFTAFWLVILLVLVLATAVSIHQHLFVAIGSLISAAGCIVFAMLRHAEAEKAEESLRFMTKLTEYAKIMRDRSQEASRHYSSLLHVGDERVKHYYDTIMVRAEEERAIALDLRLRAELDRGAIVDVEQRIYDMAERHVQDHMKWSSEKLRFDPESYQRNKNRLAKAFEFVESTGYTLPPEVKKRAVADLKTRYKEIVRERVLKDEQLLIKRQMREEERIRKESDKKIREAEQQEKVLQDKLTEAIASLQGEHSAEVDALRQELLEAQAIRERAKSMAQLTRMGHVYILSNIGSLGEGIYKVGMTRRLEPELRVKELGDASVPFPFDVHAMISCEDAPTLEKRLHHELTQYRVNRINLRKEYFRVDLDTIISAMTRHQGSVEYVAEPEALQYRESLNVSAEDLVEIEADLVEMGLDIEESDD